MNFCITAFKTPQAVMIIVKQIKETTYNFFIDNTSLGSFTTNKQVNELQDNKYHGAELI